MVVLDKASFTKFSLYDINLTQLQIIMLTRHLIIVSSSDTCSFTKREMM